MFCLDPSALFEPVAVGVLVNSGFGSDDGSGTTKLVSVLNEEYRQLLCLKDVKADRVSTCVCHWNPSEACARASRRVGRNHPFRTVHWS